jgi:spore coat polysaccharide biosynthesis protein SpsF
LLILIQSRLNSRRFPGKALHKIKGVPLILRVYEQVRKSKFRNKVIVALSNAQSDNRLAIFLKKNKINFFRGSLNNVAKRLFDTSIHYRSKFFMRINGDSPLIEPSIIDRAIQLHKNNKEYDIITNVMPRSYPKGQSVEIISTEIMSKYIKFFNKFDKEHVTAFFYKKKNICLIKNFKSELLRSKVNQCIDYPTDIKRLNKYF